MPKTLKQWIIALLFILAVSSLHLKMHSQIAQYLTQLKNMQKEILMKSKVITSNIGSSQIELKQSTEIDKKIKLLEQSITKQRTLLIELIKNSYYDLNQTKWTCPTLSNGEQLKQTNFIALFKNCSANINKITDTNNSRNIDVLKSDVGKIQTDFETYISPVYSQGNEIQRESYVISNYTNINVGKWILGNMSDDEIVNNLSSNQEKHIQMCPFQNPFRNKGGECQNCPNQKPYFLIYNSTCVDCSKYDQKLRKCIDQNGNQITGKVFFTNFQAGKNRIILDKQKTFQQLSKNEGLLPVCQVNVPFYNGTTCIDCQSPLLFSLIQNTCQTCPQSYYYDVQTHQCNIQLYFSNLNSFTWQTTQKSADDILESISLKRSNSSFIQCPLSKPFSNQTVCIACSNTTHFNYDTLNCTQCPSDTVLDLNMHRCLKPGNLNFQTNPLTSNNLIYNGRSKNQWVNLYYQNLQNYNGIVDCPSDSPFFDGLACISCPSSHPYFNMQVKVCYVCEGTTLYDQNLKQCVSGDQDRSVQKPTWEKMAAVVFA